MLSLVINLLLLSVFLFIFTMSIYFLVSLKIENTKLKLKNIQLTSDMIASLAFVSDKINQDPIIDNQATEDFLKFVSDSRDSAYLYIENVQSVLNKFISNVGPTIDYLDQYAPPILLEKQRLCLIEGYKDIKSVLPEEYGKLDT